MSVLDQSQNQDTQNEEDVYFNFINSIKSEVTKRIYENDIKLYLKFCNLTKLSELLMITDPQKQMIKYIMSLRKKGIDHQGIVSEKQKIDLFRRGKVFLFPSLFEGFGIAVGEALSAKMIVVTWKIPAFEERFPCQFIPNLRLVNVGNEELFVENALKAIDDYDRLDFSQTSTKNFGINKTWDQVGKLVVDALETSLI